MACAEPPNEVMESIFTFAIDTANVWVRVDNLRSFSLVCRAWAPVAQKMLFSTYAYHHQDFKDNRMGSRLGFMEETPHCARHVVHLQLKTMSPAKDEEYPRQLARLFPNVSCVRIAPPDITKENCSMDEASFASMLSGFHYLRRLELITGIGNPLPTIFPGDMTLDELYFEVGWRSAHVPSILRSIAHTTTGVTLKRAILMYLPVVCSPHMWKQTTQQLELFTGLTHLGIGLENYKTADDDDIPVGVDRWRHCYTVLCRDRG
jgi:hypothetical protein